MIIHESDLIEPLADYAHATWSGWMKYLFDCSKKQKDGSVLIPKRLVERWTRQMETSYFNLSDKEKKSDIAEAKTILKIIQCTEEAKRRR